MQSNITTINPTFMKDMMFNFRELLIQLLIIVEDVVCDSIKLYCIIQTCLYYLALPSLIYMHHKLQLHNLHEVRIYCRTVVLDSINFSEVYLIKWQLSVFFHRALYTL